MSHPFKKAPDRSFWSRAVSGRRLGPKDDISRSSFKIAPSDRVATAGSCFAQHVSRYLSTIGIQPFRTERPHQLVADQADSYLYNVYPARFGNIYTARQLKQLLLRAYGNFKPAENIWVSPAGLYTDPYRPGIPEGFTSEEELLRDQEQHFRSVRKMFEDLNVFVFTLGLTEGWISRKDGACFPSCPGTMAGQFNEDEHAFINFSVIEVIEDLKDFIDRLRDINPECRIILTVSPVALVATATGEHVLVANTYSKSVLRVAAQEICLKYNRVDYFPSFEIINNPSARGAYFTSDSRGVTDEGVAVVMSTFSHSYGLDSIDLPLQEVPFGSDAIKAQDEIAEASLQMNIVCEELNNDSNFDSKP
ncbi:GSCFA domain-containing protein [Methylobacterium sp. J-078]|uniref:GSCFA domain-containing protein n=1 Tax=Methylobacterium sp. J-078 TaxID=2836657 RepID=UPI001FB97B00|nr:GSCFA domain-containing protein [Methylobacterium sp. J-078]MCJ2043553.1 GSCFA domain-containing protein [Methylobacterium sp. J-078]